MRLKQANHSQMKARFFFMFFSEDKCTHSKPSISLKTEKLKLMIPNPKTDTRKIVEQMRANSNVAPPVITSHSGTEEVQR